MKNQNNISFVPSWSEQFIKDAVKKYMNKNLMDSDEVAEIKKEKKVKIMKKEREKKSLFSRFNLSNSEKIRKLYFKKMKLYEKKQVIVLKDYLTPEELKQMVESQTKDKIDEITNLGAVKIRLRSLFSALGK